MDCNVRRCSFSCSTAARVYPLIQSQGLMFDPARLRKRRSTNMFYEKEMHTRVLWGPFAWTLTFMFTALWDKHRQKGSSCWDSVDGMLSQWNWVRLICLWLCNSITIDVHTLLCLFQRTQLYMSLFHACVGDN